MSLFFAIYCLSLFYYTNIVKGKRRTKWTSPFFTPNLGLYSMKSNIVKNVEYFTFYRRVCCSGCRSFGNKSFLRERRSFPEFAHQRQPAFTK